MYVLLFCKHNVQMIIKKQNMLQSCDFAICVISFANAINNYN